MEIKTRTERYGQEDKENESNDNECSFSPKELYLKRIKEIQSLIERCVKEENSLKVYISNCKEKVIKGVSKFEKLQASELVKSKGFKERNKQKVKDKAIEKKIHGKFNRDLPGAMDNEKPGDSC